MVFAEGSSGRSPRIVCIFAHTRSELSLQPWAEISSVFLHMQRVSAMRPGREPQKNDYIVHYAETSSSIYICQDPKLSQV